MRDLSKAGELISNPNIYRKEDAVCTVPTSPATFPALTSPAYLARIETAQTYHSVTNNPRGDAYSLYECGRARMPREHSPKGT